MSTYRVEGGKDFSGIRGQRLSVRGQSNRPGDAIPGFNEQGAAAPDSVAMGWSTPEVNVPISERNLKYEFRGQLEQPRRGGTDDLSKMGIIIHFSIY